jgi:hypothetical protein
MAPATAFDDYARRDETRRALYCVNQIAAFTRVSRS